MTVYEDFSNERLEEIAAQGEDSLLLRSTCEWVNLANKRKYSYHFEWLGRPIIQ